MRASAFNSLGHQCGGTIATLGLSPLNCLASSLCQLIKFLGAGVAFVCPPIKLLGKFPVEPGQINSVSGFCSASLFDGPRAVVVSIVGHDIENEFHQC